MAIKVPEAAGAALVKEAQAGGTPKLEVIIGGKAREKAQEGNWKQGLESLRRPPVEAEQIKKRTEQIRDTGRRGNAEGHANFAKKVADTGYDGLSAGDQATLRTKLIAEAMRVPVFAEELKKIAGDPTKLNAFAERFLKENPQFTGHVREIFQRLHSAEQAPRLGADIDAATEEQQKAQDAKDQKNEEVEENKRQQARVKTALESFDKNADGTFKNPGDKGELIQSLKARMPTITSEIAMYENQETSKSQHIDDLRRERDISITGTPKKETTVNGEKVDTTVVETTMRRTPEEIDRKIEEEQGKLAEIRKNIADRKASVQKLTDLENDEKALRGRGGGLAEEYKTKSTELKDAEINLARRTRELGEATRLQTSHEQDIVDGYADVLREATAMTIGDEITALGGPLESELQHLKESAKDSAEKAMYEAMQKRWTKTVSKEHGFLIKKTVDHHVRNTANINKDYDELITKGPEHVLENMLTSQINPATKVNYTPAEAKDILNNPAYKETAKAMEKQMVKQLLANKIVTGGINKEDAFVITNSEWGEGMIEEALKVRTEFREAIEKLTEAGALNKPGSFERVKALIKEKPWLLALLIGLLPLGMVIGAAAIPAVTGGIATAGVGSVIGGAVGLSAGEAAIDIRHGLGVSKSDEGIAA